MNIPISICLFFLLPNILLNAPNLVLAVYEYHVVGQLFCNDSPWQNELVKLYDEDLITFDDLLGENRTDNNGHFQIRGGEDEAFFEDSQFQPTPFLVTQDKCDPNVDDLSQRVYLIRDQKEHNIKIIHEQQWQEPGPELKKYTDSDSENTYSCDSTYFYSFLCGKEFM